MKLALCLVVVFFTIVGNCLANIASSNSESVAVSGVGVQEAHEPEIQQIQPAAHPIGSDLDFGNLRLRKSAGYGASIPSPPCPKNYLFSCQPNLSPIACSAPASSPYGSQGAYSNPVPTYIIPQGNGGYGGYPNSGPYIPQSYAYPNQYYQY